MTSQPEQWATTPAVRELLANILKEPVGEHTAAVDAVLNGPLLDAHVAGIFRLLKKKRPRSEVWNGAGYTDIGFALHAVIYHLLGGAATKLLPPPHGGTLADACRACRHGYSVEAKRDYFKDLAHANSTRNESWALRLRSTVFDSSSYTNLNERTAATSRRSAKSGAHAMLLLGSSLEQNFHDGAPHSTVDYDACPVCIEKQAAMEERAAELQSLKTQLQALQTRVAELEAEGQPAILSEMEAELRPEELEAEVQDTKIQEAEVRPQRSKRAAELEAELHPEELDAEGMPAILLEMRQRCSQSARSVRQQRRVWLVPSI